ncbi:MAG: hypothetical protein JXB48_23280 [Candidatus Latescibacteria bacterium]|nr:hypothetical protein [Candidatus Latescibacterota bacterium]
MDLLDIITNIPNRTRIVKAYSDAGELLGLTGVLLTPQMFMKHCYGHGNHIGTNNTFFFSKNANKSEVLLAIFRHLTEIRPVGHYIGFIEDDIADDFRNALERVPHVVAEKVMETGFISTADPQVESRLLKEHEHLSRQINRFRNKGGTVHIQNGFVDNELADDFVACCLDSYRKNQHPGSDIDVDLYGEHVRKFINTFPSAVYIYAKLNDKVVGVQIFIKHENYLELTEGGFLSDTYHAYENIIIASVRYAAELGLDRVSYGLILNQTKDRLMDQNSRKPVFMVMFFRNEVDPASLNMYKYGAHQRFPMLRWKDRNEFSKLAL